MEIDGGEMKNIALVKATVFMAAVAGGLVGIIVGRSIGFLFNSMIEVSTWLTFLF